MKKILLFTDLNKLDRRVLEPCNYKMLWNDYCQQQGGNTGNKLFTLAVEKLLLRDDVTYQHYDRTMTKDYINHNFDIILIPMANILNPHPTVKREMEELAQFFNDIKVRTYIIGIGAQVATYDDLDKLCIEIREPATRFLSAIYNTGGECALRGEFTNEVFKTLGFNSAVVTGCPSIYQLGRNIEIKKKKIEEKDFKASLNGDVLYLQEANILRYLRARNVFFVDQNEFIDILYDPEYNFTIEQVIKKYTYDALKALTEKRVKLYYDIPTWIKFFKQQNIDFSFGSRIHGNIIALLSGTPAMVFCRDTRTREMAEFFKIPHVEKVDKHTSLYDLFCQADYEEFNSNFSTHYDAYERFYVDNDILPSIGEGIDNYNKWYNNVKYEMFESGALKDNTKKIQEIVYKHAMASRLIDSKYYYGRKAKRLIKDGNSR